MPAERVNEITGALCANLNAGEGDKDVTVSRRLRNVVIHEGPIRLQFKACGPYAAASQPRELEGPNVRAVQRAIEDDKIVHVPGAVAPRTAPSEAGSTRIAASYSLGRLETLDFACGTEQSTAQ
jgi:hypothetical protein